MYTSSCSQCNQWHGNELHHQQGLPQAFQLGFAAACAKPKAVLARVQRIGFVVHHIVPTVHQKVDGEAHIQQAKPKCWRFQQLKAAAGGEEVEPNGGKPQSRTRYFQVKQQRLQHGGA